MHRLADVVRAFCVIVLQVARAVGPGLAASHIKPLALDLLEDPATTVMGSVADSLACWLLRLHDTELEEAKQVCVARRGMRSAKGNCSLPRHGWVALLCLMLLRRPPCSNRFWNPCSMHAWLGV